MRRRFKYVILRRHEGNKKGVILLDILGRYKLAFVKVFLGTFVFLMSPSAKTSVDASFLTHLHQAIPSIINDEEVGVIDPLLNRDAQQVWKEISSKGYSQRSHGSDKELRSIFGQLQTSIEQLMLQHIAKNSKHTAVWIIHTPLIATPLVTKGRSKPRFNCARYS